MSRCGCCDKCYHRTCGKDTTSDYDPSFVVPSGTHHFPCCVNQEYAISSMREVRAEAGNGLMIVPVDCSTNVVAGTAGTSPTDGYWYNSGPEITFSPCEVNVTKESYLGDLLFTGTVGTTDFSAMKIKVDSLSNFQGTYELGYKEGNQTDGSWISLRTLGVGEVSVITTDELPLKQSTLFYGRATMTQIPKSCPINNLPIYTQPTPQNPAPYPLFLRDILIANGQPLNQVLTLPTTQKYCAVPGVMDAVDIYGQIYAFTEIFQGFQGYTTDGTVTFRWYTPQGGGGFYPSTYIVSPIVTCGIIGKIAMTRKYDSVCLIFNNAPRYNQGTPYQDYVNIPILCTVRDVFDSLNITNADTTDCTYLEEYECSNICDNLERGEIGSIINEAEATGTYRERSYYFPPTDFIDFVNSIAGELSPFNIPNVDGICNLGHNIVNQDTDFPTCVQNPGGGQSCYWDGESHPNVTYGSATTLQLYRKQILSAPDVIDGQKYFKKAYEHGIMGFYQEYVATYKGNEISLSKFAFGMTDLISPCNIDGTMNGLGWNVQYSVYFVNYQSIPYSIDSNNQEVLPYCAYDDLYLIVLENVSLNDDPNSQLPSAGLRYYMIVPDFDFALKTIDLSKPLVRMNITDPDNPFVEENDSTMIFTGINNSSEHNCLFYSPCTEPNLNLGI